MVCEVIAAVLQQINQPLVVATADHCVRSNRQGRDCLAHRCTLVKHWTPVHKKLYSNKSTTRLLLWRQLTMVCEVIAEGEIASRTGVPLESTGRPVLYILAINHSLVVVTADHGM